MPEYMPFLLAVAGGYLLGSIPFGLVLSRAAGIDLRGVGSGNIGATNVLRTGRKDLALATLLLDSFKAGVAVLLFSILFSRNVGLIAGAAAFFGHCFPVWLRFDGGKGVATYAGLLMFASWKALIVGLPVWPERFCAVARVFPGCSFCCDCCSHWRAFARRNTFCSLRFGWPVCDGVFHPSRKSWPPLERD